MKKKKNKAPYIIIMAAAGVLWALVIVMIVVLGVPDKVNAARVGKQIDLGNKYLAEANYDKAEVKFAKALKISSCLWQKICPTYFKIGRTYFRFCALNFLFSGM